MDECDTLTTHTLNALAMFDFDDKYRISVKECDEYMAIGIADHNLIQPNGKPAYCHIRVDKTKAKSLDMLKYHYWLANIIYDWMNTVGTKRYAKYFANGFKTPGKPAYMDWQ